MRTRRSAFTLIEVLVSVMLISIVVLGIIKIRQENVSMMDYITRRIRGELENSLFLSPLVLRYNGDEKDALTLLEEMHVNRIESRRILKAQRRLIHVSDPLPTETSGFPVLMKRIMLKGDFPARYYRFDIQKSSGSKIK